MPKIVPATQPVSQPPAILTPLERIAEISEKVKVAAEGLNRLVVEIESVALETQEYIDKVNKDGAKLRQLQDLLKGLS